MTDKELRREAQALGWYVAANKSGGKAHIVYDQYNTLCDAPFDNRCYVRWSDLCKRCRRIAEKRLTQ